MGRSRAQAKIERIMDAAYEAAFKVLEEEVRKFMRADPRFTRYVHAVGWGPAFDMAGGGHIAWSHDMPTKRGREIMEFCGKFYSTYGAANEQVLP